MEDKWLKMSNATYLVVLGIVCVAFGMARKTPEGWVQAIYIVGGVAFFLLAIQATLAAIDAVRGR